MGQITRNYPNNKAAELYYLLSETYHVSTEERDPATGLMVPRSNADIKRDCDQEIFKSAWKRCQSIRKRDRQRIMEAEHLANDLNIEFTE